MSEIRKAFELERDRYARRKFHSRILRILLFADFDASCEQMGLQFTSAWICVNIVKSFIKRPNVLFFFSRVRRNKKKYMENVH